MQRKVNYLIVLGVILMISVIIGTSGCSKSKSTSPISQAPGLPPQSSFIMDFSDFATSSKGPQFTGDPTDTFPRVNWGQSALRVGFWNTVLTVVLAVPTAAFVESFNHTPIRLSDGSWQWSYNVAAGEIYTCHLVGNIVSSQVQWKMYVSKQGAFTDYLWYSGSHDLLATQGTWTVNRNPDQTNPFLHIDWFRNTSDGTTRVKYTNFIPNDPENGSYVDYTMSTISGIDRRYNIFDVVQDNLTQIEWDHTNKNGRITDSLFYHDAEWHCWDENRHDVACQ